jgi:putative membrane protein
VKNWIVRWIANIVALFIVAQTVPGIRLDTAHMGSLIVAVIALAFANSIIRPIIMFFAWPINCLTFGLLGFVINVLLFWIVGSGIVPGFEVKGFFPALIGSVVMGIVSGLISFLLKDRGDKDED